MPRRVLGGKAGWPGFYRRDPEGVTARRSGVASRRLSCSARYSPMGCCGLYPTSHPLGAGLLVEKLVGLGFTAARRQASRLAQGVVPLDPAPCPMRAGLLVEKLVGRGFTAVTRKGSRLAGLVGQ